MTTREIVTLQLGHYANFVGTHWWNSQESSFIYTPQQQTDLPPREVNHDVLFREGQTLHGEVTYTPRLIAVDLRGSLNTLQREGTLYEAGHETDVNWEGDVTLHESNPAEKNDFLEDLDKVEAEQTSDHAADVETPSDDASMQTVEAGQSEREDAVFGRKLYNLDKSVSVWSDFLRLHLHPKSIHILQDQTHNNSEQAFDVFSLGQQVLKNVDVLETLENQIHFFVEECDHLQGFQLLVDWCDGFGGLGASVLQLLEDEYSNKSRLTFALSPAVMPDRTAHHRANRIINNALCLDKGSNLSSLFIPLSLTDSLWKTMGAPRTFPSLDYKAELSYHTSSILATSLDTMTLPYRREGQTTHLSDITSSFSNLGRKVSALYSNLPFPISQDGTFVESLLSYKGQAPWYSLTPNVSVAPDPYMQSCVVRGVPAKHINRSTPSQDVPGILTGCKSVDEILQLYLSDMYPRCLNAGSSIRDPSKVVSPYPHIFSRNVSNTGLISDRDRPSNTGVDSVPVMTSLQSNDAILNLTNTLHREASRFNIRKHHRFLEAGLEEDELKESLDSLADLSHCYHSDTSLY